MEGVLALFSISEVVFSVKSDVAMTKKIWRPFLPENVDEPYCYPLVNFFGNFIPSN